MKKSIAGMIGKMRQDGTGSMKGGFASIRGGLALTYFSTNTAGCTNSGACAGNNTGSCTNTGTCSDATNSANACTNKASCIIK